MQRGLLIVISGPSGVGKNTVINYLLNFLPDLKYSISATTRKPRPNEVDGQHYFFMSETEFVKKIESSAFLEWAKVYDNYYGTPRNEVEKVLDTAKDVILDIDVQGALQVKRSFPEAILIYLAPPSLDELKQRLLGRHTEDEKAIELRLQNIKNEFTAIPDYDFFVVNKEIDLTCKQIECIIQSEKCRVSRQEPNFLDKIYQDKSI